VDATVNEAGVLDSTAETATLVQVPALRTQILGQLACYAAAVRNQEWPAMASGNSSPVVTAWASKIRGTLVAIGDDGKDNPSWSSSCSPWMGSAATPGRRV
jgi:hypothetical protein